MGTYDILVQQAYEEKSISVWSTPKVKLGV